MTSPALFVLSLAFVCSICGIASEQKADHGILTKMRHHDLMEKWTKSSHIHNEHTPTTAYTYSDIQIANFKMHQKNLRAYSGDFSHDKDLEVHRRIRRDVDDPRCESFEKSEDNYIMHPHQKNSLNKHYFNDTNCVLVVNATDNQIIQLTFVDMFRIEYHPQCAYDYLEIRDGLHGYADLLGKFCGEAFPRQLVTSGPNVWLKFKSDDTIEYEGFKIQVVFKEGLPRRIPQACYIPLGGEAGIINKSSIPKACTDFSEQSLDVLWTIQTAPNTRIYLNFTTYELVKPNECEENVIQVFGAVLELDPKNLYDGLTLTQYCGSVANSVTTKEGADGNIMHVRFFGSKLAREAASFRATYNAYRTLDQSKETDCKEEEFNCDDNTCIAKVLMCDGDAHCRLKADEDKTTHCGEETQSTLSQTHIIVILVIFSLILSGMSFVFLFKCIRKLYQDHKIIKAHIRQSCEDRLDSIVGSRLTLDPKRLQRDSEPRASLERDNKTNELKKQRSFSKHKQSSIESDYIEETHLDLDDEPWRREVDSIPVEAEDIRIERNGRTRRSDFSKKEESIRSRTKDTDRDERREKKEIRDVSVGAPDTKESGCQTRESLFQSDAPPSSDDSHNYCMARKGFDKAPTGLRLSTSKEQLFTPLSFPGSGTNSRGFSTFGYSGATIARPSPPAATNTSEITIELLNHERQQETKNQKKLDRRPISTETTRSAPDVIIVSKPIR